MKCIGDRRYAADKTPTTPGPPSTIGRQAGSSCDIMRQKFQGEALIGFIRFD